MAIDLQALNTDRPRPTGLTIEHVNDAETLKTWCHLEEFPEFIEAFESTLKKVDIVFFPTADYD